MIPAPNPPRIAVTDTVPDALAADIGRLAPSVRLQNDALIDDAAAVSIEVLVTTGAQGASRASMQRFPNLRAVACHSVGVDLVDLEAAAERGIQVSNTPGVLDACVADLTLGLMLAVVRRVCEADRFVREGHWLQGRFPLAASLGGKCCGIVGMGRIGEAIARRACAFDMTVEYHSRRPKTELPYRYHAELADLADAADVLVVIVPGGAETTGLIDATVLEHLGPAGYLVNVSRGSVVDEPALVSALQAGTIAGAALDVFADEPCVPDAVTRMDNVVLSPHNGSATHETRAAMARCVVENVEAFLRTDRVLNEVLPSSA